MDSLTVPYRSVKGLTFSVYSSEEIRKLSVLEITNLKTFDNLGHPTSHGLHDPILGPTEPYEVCRTCGLEQLYCPGHIGHISLPLTVFNPFLLDTLVKILRGICFNCYHLLAMPVAVQLALAQLRVLDYGFVGVAQALEEMVSELLTKETIKSSIALAKGIEEKLSQHVKAVLEGADLEEARKSSSVKNVLECRQRIIKNFIKNHVMKTRERCYQCQATRRKLALYNYSCIIFKDRSKARKTISVQMKNLSINENNEDETNEGNNVGNILNDISNQSFLTAIEARDHLRKTWENEKLILKHLFGILNVVGGSYVCPVDVFFIDDLVVTPPRFRPVNVLKGNKYENSQTAALRKVLQYSILVREILKAMKEGLDAVPTEDPNLMMIMGSISGSTLTEKLNFARVMLQLSVNAVADNEMDKISKEKYPGTKQILEKKEGLFRKHMMGKRVDFAARSVISPDPYIMVDEVGIPLIFAKSLTYPQPVTPWNVRELRQAVINGPNSYPGAVLVKNENGNITKLNAENHVQREAIAKRLLTPTYELNKRPGRTKIVYRHLKNGDVLLLNRQPTLHKPSIMAHKARVLPGEKTLRLHYANCKCYNADFDGDEMNAHFPQNELGRSEAYNISSVNYQYLVPKDGTPLSGLIQDHVVAGSLLSMRGRFFNREDYQELVYGALTFIQQSIKILPPCILKPRPLWSGKQIISTVILNIIPPDKPPLTIGGPAKIRVKNWQNSKPHTWLAGGMPLRDNCMSESEVVILSGELLCGVLDKAHYGPTPYGLVHCCYELYGGQISTLLLTSLARLFTHFLQIYTGFTLGIEDILVTSKANKKRNKIMKTIRKIGNEVVADALDVPNPEDERQIYDHYQTAHLSRNDLTRKQLDAAMKSKTDQFTNLINRVCIPSGLIKKFPLNNLQLMIQSGAKGTAVNAMQISCLLGQIELEGRRVPLMSSGKSLPSFMAYDTSPRAGGFVDGRFLTGIRPQEYFFHCMAGREGLVDTAVKTSKSGYLQRCLIKHLEGIVINYDLTVRDSDGSVIQFQYGEDGLDISKMQMLKENQFQTLITNYDAVVKEGELEQLQRKLNTENTKSQRKRIKKWIKQHGNYDSFHRASGFTVFSSEFLKQMQTEHPGKNESGCEHAKEKLCELWHDLDPAVKDRYNDPWDRRPDPISSKSQMDICFGSISEKMDSIIENYILSDPDKVFSRRSDGIKKFSKSQFRNLLYYKYLKALAEPGEAVGLLAAQSVGEPSTQMTLNTFHFAGRGEMNVTLGIPRLREILMGSSTSKISTPSMDLPLLPIYNALDEAEVLRLKFTAVLLAQVLEKLKIVETLRIEERMNRYRIYHIYLNFLPYKAYKKKFFVNPSSILKYVESIFLKRLINAMKRKLFALAASKLVGTYVSKRFRLPRNNESDEPNVQEEKEDGESSDEGEGDGDTTSAKNRSQHNQEQEYEEPEEEERMKDNSENDNMEDEETLEVNGEKEDNEENDKRMNEEENEKINEEESGKMNEEETVSLRSISHHKKKKKISEVEVMVRKQKALCHAWIADYEFDTKKEEWCKVTLQVEIHHSKLDMATLVEEETQKAIVYQIPCITKAFVVDDINSKSGSGKMIKTEGVNIQAMLKYENILDINRIYSNDINAIAQTYGIEAAARVIVKEVSNVFGAYGIKVDPRHLSLIADYMTFDGTCKPCNRVGIECSASPLQQMTFETTMKFLNSATLTGTQEHLKSPSSRLVVGHLVSGGTGCFDLLQPLVQIRKN